MGAVRIKFVAPFSEPHLTCSPWWTDLNNIHKYSNMSYGDLFGRGSLGHGVGTGAGFGGGVVNNMCGWQPQVDF